MALAATSAKKIIIIKIYAVIFLQFVQDKLLNQKENKLVLSVSTPLHQARREEPSKYSSLGNKGGTL